MTKKTLVVFVAVLAFASAASAQKGQRFTVHHVIKFTAGTERERAALRKIASVRPMVKGSFEVANEDLNDDGIKETIVMESGVMEGGCGSMGCHTTVTVLEERPAGIAILLLNQRMLEADLAVTNEKVGNYRALAVVDAADDKGRIYRFDAPRDSDEPWSMKQMVYPMKQR